MRHRLLAFLAFSLLAAGSARAQLTTLQTDDLRLVYQNPTQTYMTPHVARCFVNSMRFQRELFGYTPKQQVTVLLDDYADFGNASVSAVPRDSLILGIAPVSFVYETLPANEAINWTMNHELVHVAAMDKAAGGDRFFRGLFGGKVGPIAAQPESIVYSYLTAPRAAAPRWYQEGLAVFVETWMAGGRGRAQGAWDEMVFRAMVKDGSRFYDPLGLVSEGTKIDFQLEANSYLYGTRFMSYLAYRYTPEALVRWAARSDGSRAYYASQFRHVFGVSVNEAWRDWIAYEREFQQKNLEEIRRYPTTPYEDVSRQALGGISRSFYDPEAGKIYAAFNYPGVVAHIGSIALADGALERIQEIKDPLIYAVTSLAWDPASKTIFYATDNHEYRDVRALDPRTRRSRTLLKDARIGELVFDKADKSLWGIRHFNGIATLVRIPPPYDDWKQVRSWPFGETIYDMDISPDGTLLSASVGEIDGSHSLRVMKVESLLAGDPTPVAQTDFGTAIPMNFVFSEDGKALYGSSFYTGVANVFRFTPATGALDALSNTETGFFRPLPLQGDTLLVFRYTGEGFVPARIQAKKLEDVSAITFFGQTVVEKYPQLKEWSVGSPAKVPLDSLSHGTSAYRILGGTRLESFYPVMNGYKDSVGYGMRVNFSDALQLNRFNLTASVSPTSDLPSNERFHLDAQYERYDWSGRFRYNAPDFYDLFGPTKTSRKGYAFGVGYKRILVQDKPRNMDFAINATYYTGIDELPDYQNVEARVDTLLAMRTRVRYTNLRHSLGNVDEEKGHAWEVALANDHLEGRSFPRLSGSLDIGVPLALKHSSLFLRSAAGYSPRDRVFNFANFYFGGFGNNWVDYRNEKRYREDYAFPGVGINELSGTSYVKSMLEWNLPPIRFRRAGSPGFYLSWARPALFASGIVTNLDSSRARQEVGNVGAQLDFKLSVLSRLDMTLSFGQAVAFEDGRKPRYETMVSLKILRQ